MCELRTMRTLGRAYRQMALAVSLNGRLRAELLQALQESTTLPLSAECLKYSGRLCDKRVSNGGSFRASVNTRSNRPAERQDGGNDADSDAYR